MPQPDVVDVHVDAILTNFSLAYKNLGYISDQIFPVISVQKQSDKYFTYPRSAWFRDQAQKRAPATESAGGGYTLSTDSYYAENYAYHFDIPDEVRANADNPINPDLEAVNFVTDKLMMSRERLWVSTFFGTGIWTGAADATGGSTFTLWSTYGTSDPILDLETRMNTMRIATGKRPNTLVMGAAVWSSLKNHPDFIDRIKYTQKGLVTKDLFASLIDLNANNIHIGEAIVDTSLEGAATVPVMSDIWGKHALLLYVEPGAGPMSATAGLTYVWSKFGGGALQYMRRLRLDKTLSDRIEGQSFFDQKIVAADLGAFFSGVVA